MQVHRDINNLPLFKNAVVTIGTFDGVHTGHLRIISQLKEEAEKISGTSVIITFEPHPRTILSPGSHLKLLNTLDEKIRLLEKQGIDDLVVVDFTKEFSEQPAEEYIKKFLVKKFHPHTVIIGYDHHFGKARKGNYKLLEAYSDRCNYTVKEIPEHILNQVTISSTKIRDAILNCDIATANKYLGYDYFFEGEVVEGDKLGRTLGYPTANLQIKDEYKLVPADGVYAVSVSIGNGQLAMGNRQSAMGNGEYTGMMSIGVRPTIGNSQRAIEVNIFDFSENIYGETVRVCVKRFLREQKKFKDLDALKDAIANDKIETLKFV